MARTRRFHPVILVIGLLLTTPAGADPASPQEMRQVCRAWLDHRVAAQGGWSGSQAPEITGEQPITQGDDVLGLAFRIAPQGFVLVPARRELSPVWFFSETGSLDFNAENVAAVVLRGRLALATEIVTGKTGVSDSSRGEVIAAAGMKNRSRWARMTEKSAEWMREYSEPAAGVGPLLSTTWHQGPPYNLFCPLASDSVRCVAGCTPIAAAQIARYYAYPPHGGAGEEDYRWDGDRCGTSRPALLHADFRNAYDWDHMPNACSPSCGSRADSAVAELCYELGVGAHAEFGTSCGTSASLPQLTGVLQEHFGYDSLTERAYRGEQANAYDWFALLRRELDTRRPILYSFNYRNGAGTHALVCDGWSIDAGIEFLSLNLGGGGVTGWYAADDNGMSDPMWDAAILHLAPVAEPELLAPADSATVPTQTARLAWRGSPQILSYEVQMARDAGFTVLDADLEGLSDTTCVVGPPRSHTRYWWRVIGRNDRGAGKWSAARNFVTLSIAAAFVRPGDTNNDGTVDARDVIPIGLYYRGTGCARPDGSLEWTEGGQVVPTAWDRPVACYADCDGNGRVEAADVAGVIENWGYRLGSPPPAVDRAAACRELLWALDAAGSTEAFLAVQLAVVDYLRSRLDIRLHFAVEPAWPNPFRDAVTLRCTLPEGVGEATLAVYNARGSLVARSSRPGAAAGAASLVWDGNDLHGARAPSGVYFYRIAAGPHRASGRMILVR